MSDVEQTQAAPGAIATDAPAPEVRISEGDKLGRYVVLSRLGAGAMGVVYAAFDPQLDRKVAVKVMTPALAQFGDPKQTRKQMIHEARALARIAHPHVVSVYDVGTVHERVFIAMEFVEGQTLDRWLADTERPWTEILAKMLEAGRGLAAAHEQGVVHCDFKPANVIAGADGRVRVMDFGLARAKRRAAFELLGQEQVRASTLEQQPGIAQGTPAYMAPEQYSTPGDARADQFSFCVATWEALFSERPFAGEIPPVLLRATLDGEIREPPAGSPVPAWVRTALERGLSAFPDARFPSMADLLNALERDPTRSRRWVVMGGAAGLLALVGGGVWWAVRSEASRQCDAFADTLGSAWTAESRDTLESALRGTDLSYAGDTIDRLLPMLDAYADDLRAGGRTVCREAELDGSLDAELYARARACLEERRATLAGLVSGLDDQPAESVRHAISVGAELPEIGSCTDRAWLESASAVLPPDPDTLASAVELKAELGSLTAFQAASDFSRGLERAEAILASAEALGWDPLVARALVEVAYFSYSSGDAKAAEDSYARAFEVATAADRDDLAAVSAAQAAYLLATRLGRLEEAQVWARVARARTSRASDLGGTWRGEVANGLGAVAVRAADWASCSREFGQALDIFTERFGSDHPLTARARVNLSVCELSTNRWEEGLETQLEALGQLERALGSNHPTVGVAILNRAHILQTRGRYAASQEATDRAHAILTSALGPETTEARLARAQRASLAHFRGRWTEALDGFTALCARGDTQQGMLRSSRGTVLAHLGRVDEGEAEVRRALAERIEVLGDAHPTLSSIYGALAEILLYKGDAAAALPYARKSAALKNNDYHHAEALRVLAWAHERLGARKEAIEAARRSLALMAEYPADNPFAAQTRFVLARATYPDDPGEGRALAQQALEALRSTGGDFERRAAEVEAWLAAPGGVEDSGPSAEHEE